MTQVLVTYKADGSYATVALEVPDQVVVKPLPPTGKAVGIDVGVENLLALSDGTLIDNPRWLKETQEGIAVRQRMLGKKGRGSKLWRLSSCP